jgi:aromatic ring-opening dioxygenase LigB subunit
VIVWAAIAPHGGLVFEQPDAPTRKGMEELRRRFEAADPDAVIIVTPHGTHIDGHFGVVRSATLSQHGSSFVEEENHYDGPGEPQLADACVRALQEEGLPAFGLTFGTTAAGSSEMPIDWGAAIPLTFLSAPAVVVTPCRALSNEQHVLAGQALARATEGRRVVFVASADHGHGHTADGPYGFSDQSKPYDDDIVSVVRENRLVDLVGWDADYALAAKADSFWQLLMLLGALTDGTWHAELLSYEAPTYFGMLTAAFARQD